MKQPVLLLSSVILTAVALAAFYSGQNKPGRFETEQAEPAATSPGKVLDTKFIENVDPRKIYLEAPSDDPHPLLPPPFAPEPEVKISEPTEIKKY